MLALLGPLVPLEAFLQYFGRVTAFVPRIGPLPARTKSHWRHPVTQSRFLTTIAPPAERASPVTGLLEPDFGCSEGGLLQILLQTSFA